MEKDINTRDAVRLANLPGALNTSQRSGSIVLVSPTLLPSLLGPWLFSRLPRMESFNLTVRMRVIRNADKPSRKEIIIRTNLDETIIVSLVYRYYFIKRALYTH